MEESNSWKAELIEKYKEYEDECIKQGAEANLRGFIFYLEHGVLPIVLGGNSWI